MRKPAFSICENKDIDRMCLNHVADQRMCAVTVQQISTFVFPTYGNSVADQRLCFRNIDCTHLPIRIVQNS